VKAPGRLGLIAVILILATGSLFTHRSVTSTLSRTSHDITLTTSDRAGAARGAPDDGAAVDLYGNEVSDAIATYSLDPAGSLYELHSPQTELPRLGAPKS
jgi:hypothetical protein